MIPQLEPAFFAVGAAAVLALLLLGRHFRRALIVVNLGFLGWWDPRAAALSVVLVVLAWALPGWLGGAVQVAVFVGVHLGVDLLPEQRFVVPIGLGFLVLRLLHYVVDRREAPPHGLGDVLAWALFFPAVLLGPVHRFDLFLRELNRRRWDAALAATGLERILHGYGKLVVLAGLVVGTWLEGALLPWPGLVREAVVTTARTWASLAGGADIAVGLGLLVGVRLPENFRAPFLAANLGEFWRAWHITVSEWCRVYVYVPLLARFRSGALATAGAMLVMGLWHQLSARFAVWGLYQALGIGLWRLWRAYHPPLPAGPGWSRVGHGVSIFLTQAWVMAGFAVARYADLHRLVRLAP